jgi:hypothetical protein
MARRMVTIKVFGRDVLVELDDGGSDGDASDREPRRPRAPVGAGRAEAEIPDSDAP